MTTLTHRLLTETQVAELLGVDPPVVRSWVRDGSLPMQHRDECGEALFRARDLEPLVVGLVC